LSESIDGQNDADGSITYENLIKTDESLESDYLVDEKSKNKLLQSVLNKLNSREQTILKASFGIGYTVPLNLEEIGEICGLTRERVRQLREKALERLRSAANKELLGLCL
jgi:RNA polymerase primary sigma factor